MLLTQAAGTTQSFPETLGVVRCTKTIHLFRSWLVIIIIYLMMVVVVVMLS
jgi:hypothetical protein